MSAPSAVQTIRVTAYHCLRCLHTWLPRREGRPVQCPACHSPYWDKPRKIAKAGSRAEGDKVL
jgi:DNA-directed RNA polymerase subunit RPC12/RpoP